MIDAVQQLRDAKFTAGSVCTNLFIYVYIQSSTRGPQCSSRTFAVSVEKLKFSSMFGNIVKISFGTLELSSKGRVGAAS
jgi:hypothetical protein